MLAKLLAYELYKKWKVLRYIVGGFVVLQVFMLAISRILLGNDVTKMIMGIGEHGQNGSFTLGLISLLYFGFAAGVFFLPIFETIYRFEKDLSGKQAVLELMIPIVSWKKLLAKLIVTLCTIIVCQIIASLSIVAYILVNSNFNKSIADSILKIARELLSSPGKSSYIALSLLFALALFYMLVMFCITFSKSISHKNRIAVPIGVGLFIGCVIASVYSGVQIGKFPIIKLDIFGVEQSLSVLIFEILLFVLPFLGASFLMEKRIEN